jgi:hypothetical protein
VGKHVRRWQVVASLLLTTVILFFTNGVSTVQADTPSFDVQAVLPKNQVTKGIEFFDIRVAPNQKQELQVNLANLSKQDNVVHISATAPITDLTGAVSYTQPGVKPDPSARYSIGELFEGPSSINLAPRETTTISLRLKTPVKPFDGLIIGSFIFSSSSKPSVQDDTKSHKIKNDIRVAIPVGLRSTKPSSKTVVPNLDLGDPRIVTSPFGGGAIQTRVRNIEPAFSGKVTGTIDVHDRDDSTNSFRRKQSTFGITPNSYFEMFTSWGSGTVQPGHYILNYRFSAGERNWEFTRQLIVSSEQASRVNQTQPAAQNNQSWWIIGFILTTLLFISISVLVWYRGKRRGQKMAR